MAEAGRRGAARTIAPGAQGASGRWRGAKPLHPVTHSRGSTTPWGPQELEAKKAELKGIQQQLQEEQKAVREAEDGAASALAGPPGGRPVAARPAWRARRRAGPSSGGRLRIADLAAPLFPCPD